MWRRISCSYRIDSFFFFWVSSSTLLPPKIVRACIYAVNDNVRRMFGPPLYMVVADDDDDIIRRKKKKRREVDSFTPASFLGWQSRSFSHAFHLSALYIPGWLWCSLSNPYLSIPYAALDGNRSHAAMSVSRAAAAVLFFSFSSPTPRPQAGNS